LIVSFNIFCQQEMNWIYNFISKAQQVTCDRETRPSYIFRSVRVHNQKKTSIQCNLPASIEQAQDKKNYWWSEKIDNCVYISSKSFTWKCWI